LSDRPRKFREMVLAQRSHLLSIFSISEFRGVRFDHAADHNDLWRLESAFLEFLRRSILKQAEQSVMPSPRSGQSNLRSIADIEFLTETALRSRESALTLTLVARDDFDVSTKDISHGDDGLELRISRSSERPANARGVLVDHSCDFGL
jgi:hypothetical protein